MIKRFAPAALIVGVSALLVCASPAQAPQKQRTALVVWGGWEGHEPKQCADIAPWLVKEFKLKKGGEVDVSVHPQTGAVTIRPGVRYFEDGKVTPRFAKLAEALLERRSRAYRELAK